MSPFLLRWAGAGQLRWAYYDRAGLLVREVVPEEVPLQRLCPPASVPGGYLLVDPCGGAYAAVWPSRVA